jgi:hypothetical protein
MGVRGLLRDLTLVAVAVGMGWWGRGANMRVLAQKSSSSSSSRDGTGEGSLSFQFQGPQPQQSLAIYNPANHTLYVYPRVGQGNSHVSCEYSFRIDRPGAPIDRQNCPVGEQFAK